MLNEFICPDCKTDYDYRELILDEDDQYKCPKCYDENNGNKGLIIRTDEYYCDYVTIKVFK